MSAENAYADRSLVRNSHGSGKSRLYLNNYERHFESLAHRDIRLLELGIDKGGSLLMWRDFFPKGRIVGLDLTCVDIADPTGRISVYQGNQGDKGILDRIGAECAPEGFDVIIDDASHIAELTKISFWHLFEHHLKAGGYYVIEDWRVGYWPSWPDGVKYRPSDSNWALPWLLLRRLTLRKPLFPSHSYGMVGFLKQLIDEMGMDAITNPARNGLAPQRFPRFQRMEICPGQVFVIKATDRDHDLVTQQLSGPNV